MPSRKQGVYQALLPPCVFRGRTEPAASRNEQEAMWKVVKSEKQVFGVGSCRLWVLVWIGGRGR
jgi:hypothetical protein